MLKNKLKRIKFLSLIPVAAIGIIPLVASNTNNNYQNTVSNFESRNLNSSSENVKSNTYTFYPIDGFINPYKNNFNPTLVINYSSEYENSNSFVVNPTKISFHNDIKSANKYLFENVNKSFSSISDKVEQFSPIIEDFKNPSSIIYSDGNYTMNASNNTSRYKAKLSCGKQHVGRKVCSNKNHIHNRGCSKAYWYDCRGCIDGTKNVSYTKSFFQKDYDTLIKYNNVLKSDFDFGKLIKLNQKNYIKSFDKTYLTLDYNFDYLRAMVMGSYNYSYATEFFKNNSWMFSQKISNFLAASIQQNKLTVFDQQIPTYFRYNIDNYKKEHNIRYWMDNIDKFSEEFIIETINNLPVLDFGKYLTDNKINNKNYFLGKNIMNFYSNENLLKNVIFNIKYGAGDKNTIKNFSISLFDLINKKNNKIVYKYSENVNSINPECRDILIQSINVSTSNKSSLYLDQYNTGVYFENNSNKLSYVDANNLTKNQNWINNNSLSNLFIPIEYDETKSKDLLVKNKIFGKATDNINEFIFGTLTKFETYLNVVDPIILSDVSNDSKNMLNNSIKQFIANYEMVPNNYNGTIDIKINFKDNSSLNYQVKGFEKVFNPQIEVLKENIKYSELNLDQDFKITTQYIFDNLIDYQGSSNPNSLLRTGLTKEQFQIVLETINLKTIGEITILDFVIIDDLNKLHFVFNLTNDLKSIETPPIEDNNNNNKPDSNQEQQQNNQDNHQENQKPNGNDNSNNNQEANDNNINNQELEGASYKNNGLIAVYVLIPIILAIGTGLTLYFLYKKNIIKKITFKKHKKEEK